MPVGTELYERQLRWAWRHVPAWEGGLRRTQLKRLRNQSEHGRKELRPLRQRVPEGTALLERQVYALKRRGVANRVTRMTTMTQGVSRWA